MRSQSCTADHHKSLLYPQHTLLLQTSRDHHPYTPLTPSTRATSHGKLQVHLLPDALLAWAATDQHDKCSMDPPQPEPEGHSTPQDPPRLTARAVGPSPARLTVAGVRGNTAAMHTLLGAQGCRGPGEKEKEQEQTVRTSHLVKEQKPLCNDSLGPRDAQSASLALGKSSYSRPESFN